MPGPLSLAALLLGGRNRPRVEAVLGPHTRTADQLGSSHSAAGFRTATAHLSTAPHLLVLAHAIAFLGTARTDLCTHSTRARVQIRATEHEVGARLADLGTIQEEPDVRGLGVLASELQAMRDGLHADLVAFGTVSDALLHVAAHVGHSADLLLDRGTQENEPPVEAGSIPE